MNLVTKEQFKQDYKIKKFGDYAIEKYQQWFPIKSSPALAGIVADLTGDGHLGSNMIIYYSKNPGEALRFGRETIKVFDVKGQIRKCMSNPNTCYYVIFNQPLTRILRLIGVPEGEKVSTKFRVPPWVLNGTPEVKSRYLQRLFDCEGGVYFPEKQKRVRIKIQMSKLESIEQNGFIFMEELRNMLKEFDIKTTNSWFSGENYRKDGTRTIGRSFEIQGTRKNMQNILKFKENINFETIYKRERLEKACSRLDFVGKTKPK